MYREAITTKMQAAEGIRVFIPIIEEMNKAVPMGQAERDVGLEETMFTEVC